MRSALVATLLVDDDGDGFIDIFDIVSPDCNETNLDDPAACTRCTQTESCGPSSCGGDTCILCPGQTPEDLPDSCSATACPMGSQSCADGEACPSDAYCGASFCCVSIVQ